MNFLYDIKEEDSSDISLDEPESSVTAVESYGERHLIAVIADEDTCVGYLLGGIGQMDKNECPNYAVVTEKTAPIEISRMFRDFLQRKDIAIILIVRDAAEKIHADLHLWKKTLPVVIIIPDKNGPYDVDIRHILDAAERHDEEENEHIEEQRRSITERRGSQASNSTRSSILDKTHTINM